MRFSVPLLAKVNMGFRMWMPNLPMTLVSARSATATKNASAVFRVSPKMTKWEIREYLTKIYQLPVKNVNTMNYMGARKRVIGRSRIAYLKQKDFKKAIVIFEDSLLDVGIGTRIPELDQNDDDDDAVEGQI